MGAGWSRRASPTCLAVGRLFAGVPQFPSRRLAWAHSHGNLRVPCSAREDQLHCLWWWLQMFQTTWHGQVRSKGWRNSLPLSVILQKGRSPGIEEWLQSVPVDNSLCVPVKVWGEIPSLRIGKTWISWCYPLTCCLTSVKVPQCPEICNLDTIAWNEVFMKCLCNSIVH